MLKQEVSLSLKLNLSGFIKSITHSNPNLLWCSNRTIMLYLQYETLLNTRRFSDSLVVDVHVSLWSSVPTYLCGDRAPPTVQSTKKLVKHEVTGYVTCDFSKWTITSRERLPNGKFNSINSLDWFIQLLYQREPCAMSCKYRWHLYFEQLINLVANRPNALSVKWRESWLVKSVYALYTCCMNDSIIDHIYTLEF